MTSGDAQMDTFVFLKDLIHRLLATAGHSFEVYPHGSLPKGTQVDPHGDIDIVVELRHPTVVDWRGGFVPAPGTRYGKVIVPRPPTPEFLGFKETVAAAMAYDFDLMRQGLGSLVAWGKTKKVLKVAPVLPGHVNADVLVCQRFLDRPGASVAGAEPGVVFWDGYGELRVSHPKKYIAKVREKDARTDGMYTELVRHLKQNHLDLKHRGGVSRKATGPMRHVPMDASTGVSSAALELVTYGVPNDRYTRRSLTATRKKVRDYLRGVASTERSRESFVPWDLVNDTTYLQWIDFMHQGFRMMLSHDDLWA